MGGNSTVGGCTLNACPSNSTCEETGGGSFKCICDSGFQLDNGRCTGKLKWKNKRKKKRRKKRRKKKNLNVCPSNETGGGSYKLRNICTFVFFSTILKEYIFFSIPCLNIII